MAHAPALLGAYSDGLTEELRTLPPASTVRDRIAYFEKYASYYRRLDAHRTTPITDESVSKVRSLRREYLAECKGSHCPTDLFFIEAARTLGAMAEELGDSLGTTVANYYLSGRYQSPARLARWSLQGAFAEDTKAIGQTGVSNKAKKSEKIARMATAKGAPGVDTMEGRVVGREVQEDVTTLRFGSTKRVTEELLGCVVTNRVERIYFDGTVEYEENCDYLTHEETIPGAVVQVPSLEAKDIQVGEFVQCVARPGTTTATVVYAKSDRGMVQWHDARFPEFQN